MSTKQFRLIVGLLVTGLLFGAWVSWQARQTFQQHGKLFEAMMMDIDLSQKDVEMSQDTRAQIAVIRERLEMMHVRVEHQLRDIEDRLLQVEAEEK